MAESPQIPPDVVLKEGWVTKEGAFLKTWKRRWLVLYRDKLEYYEKPDRKQIKGTIPFEEVLNIAIGFSDYKGTPPDRWFSIMTVMRNYYVMHDTSKQCQQWLIAINTVLAKRKKRLEEEAAKKGPTSPQRDPLEAEKQKLAEERRRLDELRIREEEERLKREEADRLALEAAEKERAEKDKQLSEERQRLELERLRIEDEQRADLDRQRQLLEEERQAMLRQREIEAQRFEEERRQMEDERRRLEAEERERIERVRQEEARRQAEIEAARRAEEERLKREAEQRLEDERRRLDEERRSMEAELLRMAEEERAKREEEERRRREDDERRRKEEEERLEAERRRIEEERRQMEIEAQAKAQQEQQRREEEERRRKEEEQRLEDERRRLDEERRSMEAELLRMAEEERAKREEEERRRREDDERRRKEEEERLEAERRGIEDERRQMEIEAQQRKAEEDERNRQEQERQRIESERLEAERRRIEDEKRKLELEAQRKAEEEERHRQQLEQQRQEQERVRLEREQAESEQRRVEAERLERQRKKEEEERARIELERQAAEQRRLELEAKRKEEEDRQRLEQERQRVEAERLEAERKAEEERRKKEEEERARIELEAQERERQRLEAARLEAERQANEERLAREKIEAEEREKLQRELDEKKTEEAFKQRGLKRDFLVQFRNDALDQINKRFETYLAGANTIKQSLHQTNELVAQLVQENDSRIATIKSIASNVQSIRAQAKGESSVSPAVLDKTCRLLERDLVDLRNSCAELLQSKPTLDQWQRQLMQSESKFTHELTELDKMTETLSVKSVKQKLRDLLQGVEAELDQLRALVQGADEVLLQVDSFSSSTGLMLEETKTKIQSLDPTTDHRAFDESIANTVSAVENLSAHLRQDYNRTSKMIEHATQLASGIVDTKKVMTDKFLEDSEGDLLNDDETFDEYKQMQTTYLNDLLDTASQTYENEAGPSIASSLSQQSQTKSAHYTQQVGALGNQCALLQQQLETMQVSGTSAELIAIDNQLNDSQATLDALRMLVQEKIAEMSEFKSTNRSKIQYQAAKGDSIDKMIEDTLNSISGDLEDCIPHNFARVGPGVYQFGTKRITAQILTGSLVVRVGGGFMKFEEFVSKYGKSESIKIVKSTGVSLRTTLVRKQGGLGLAETRSPNRK